VYFSYSRNFLCSMSECSGFFYTLSRYISCTRCFFSMANTNAEATLCTFHTHASSVTLWFFSLFSSKLHPCCNLLNSASFSYPFQPPRFPPSQQISSCSSRRSRVALETLSMKYTFFSKSTYTIFDAKICLESAWHWISILLKTFLYNCRFQVLFNAQT
jgi:hypothetical protein